MIQHFFKLIWNRKKTNFMTSLGIFISFIVLFLVISTIVYNAGNYFKPLGFSYKDVWYISMDWKNTPRDAKIETLLQIKKTCESFQEVEHVSFSQALILMPTVASMTRFQYEGKEARCNLRAAGDEFNKVMGIELLEGRWFNETDNASDQRPVIINKYTSEEFFGNETALGKILLRGDIECEIVGVIDEFRNGGRFTGSSNILFNRISLDQESSSNSFLAESIGSRILLKMKPGVDLQFEEILTNSLSDIAHGWQVRVNSLEAISNSADLQSVILPVILTVICGFMIINVALGLFGVIWYNTNRRRSEIGLRRALGSSAATI
jgi:putative ABC transport system permease protein